MTDIYVIRHCEAMGNHLRVFQGSTDSDISEGGKKQLEFLSERFKDIKFDVFYSSPLKRAVATAKAAMKYNETELFLDDRFKEIDAGVIEGVKFQEMPMLFPEDAHNWSLEPYLFAPEGGEKMTEVFDRVWEAISEIAQKHKGKTIGVASHGCTIRNLLCRVKGLPIERLNDIDWCDNTAVTLIRFDENMKFSCEFENDASHIPEDLSTFAKQTWWRRENAGKRVFD
jgi:probable phosphoglycerate mutase